VLVAVVIIEDENVVGKKDDECGEAKREYLLKEPCTVAVLTLVSDPLPLSELVLEFLQLLESSDHPPRELLEDCAGES